MKTTKKNKIKIKSTNTVNSSGGKWVVTIIVLSFLLSVSMNVTSAALIPKASIVLALIILFLLIMIGVLFDIIGVAVAAASETPFHSMAAGKVAAAPWAIRLIRNAEKVSNICNDVVGDTVGIISGAATAVIVTKFIGIYSFDEIVVSLLLTGLVAALTIGGKALGKGVALSNANGIIYNVACVIHFFTELGKRKKS